MITTFNMNSNKFLLIKKYLVFNYYMPTVSFDTVYQRPVMEFDTATPTFSLTEWGSALVRRLEEASQIPNKTSKKSSQLL